MNDIPYTLTRLDRQEHPIEEVVEFSPLGPKSIETSNPTVKYLATEFAYLWREFELSLERVPVVSKILNGTITLEEYKQLVLSQRQQVVDGALWFSRTISCINVRDNPNYAFLRQRIIDSLSDESEDYQQLENDYVALGGKRDEIVTHPQNIGTIALSSFMLQQASQPNPINMLGSLFIIEGLGKIKAGEWASKIDEALELDGKGLSFLNYHAVADQEHFARFTLLMNMPFITEDVAKRMVTTAKVTAALYAMQLTHINDF